MRPYKNNDHKDESLLSSLCQIDSCTTGIMLVNLGSPNKPTAWSIAKYLKEFLSDRRVIEAPRIIWFFILRFIILPLRSNRVAKLYASVWHADGAPLITGTKSLSQALASQYNQNKNIEIRWAMRYGQPDMAQVLKDWQKQGLERLIVVPLYPQYAASSVASVFDKLAYSLLTIPSLPELHFINSYYKNKKYIEAIAKSIREQSNKDDFLLLSFHGLPRSMIENGDPYFCHCHTSARLIATELKLADHQWQLCFQSRFGNKPWLQPYTDKVLEQLPAKGIDRVRIVCPGFAIDCLETLEEIAVQNRNTFIESGGQEYTYISCLNDSTDQVELLRSLIDPILKYWQFVDLSNKNSSARTTD